MLRISFFVFATQSHPSRVRGLKYSLKRKAGQPLSSHPSRVRGLKSFPAGQASWRPMVAPLAGAWIEMMIYRRISSRLAPVAPLAGAWIEIVKIMLSVAIKIPSHPSRVRGLKFCSRPRKCPASLCRTPRGCVD